MTKKIDAILSAILADTPDWKLGLLRNWNTLMGNLSSKVQVEKILEDTVVLGVYDSCWLQELYLLSPTLLTKINAILDQPRIKQLRFKKIAVNQGSRKKTFTKSGDDNKVIPTLKPTEEDRLGNVKDPQLQEVLRKFLLRCYQERE